MPLLRISDLHATYRDEVEVLHGISLTVEDGEFVTLIGANGAGKTSTLRTIMGLLRARSGSVEFRGSDISALRTSEIARLGISLVPEGRGVFPGLTVYDNLRIAATPWLRTGGKIDRELELVYGLFPVLAERRSQPGWSLSGGQQQMLAIARALVARPKLMLLDEPSLGLAPNLVDQVFDTLRRINEQGVSILLVEQNAFMALEVSDRGYVIERGRVAMHSTSAELMDDDRVKVAYLGG
jgi:branched-chain amino acid transport system ATP-binding protein